MGVDRRSSRSPETYLPSSAPPLSMLNGDADYKRFFWRSSTPRYHRRRPSYMCTLNCQKGALATTHCYIAVQHPMYFISVPQKSTRGVEVRSLAKSKSIFYPCCGNLFLVLKNGVQATNIWRDLHNELIPVMKVLRWVLAKPDARGCAGEDDRTGQKGSALRNETYQFGRVED